MAEGFARAGVPVFSRPISRATCPGSPKVGEAKDFILKRGRRGWGSSSSLTSSRPFFWDVFGEQGHPVRATVTENGAVAAVPDARFERRPGGRAQCRVPCRRRETALTLIDMKGYPCVAGCHRPGHQQRRARMPKKTRLAPIRKSGAGLRQCHQGDSRNHSAPAFWCWRTRAARNSSASRRLTLKDFMKTDSDGRGHG